MSATGNSPTSYSNTWREYVDYTHRDGEHCAPAPRFDTTSEHAKDWYEAGTFFKDNGFVLLKEAMLYGNKVAVCWKAYTQQQSPRQMSPRIGARVQMDHRCESA